MKLSEKEKTVEALHEKFSRAKTVLITDYRGLDVSKLTELRGQLRDASVEYRVVKNTLMARAAEGTDMALLREYFSGPCAVAVSYEDPIAPAKVLVKFAEGNAALEIKAGVVAGRVIDSAGIEKLSKLPSEEELLAKLLMVFNGPATGLVRVLSGVVRNFMGVLQAIKEKKEGA